MASPIPLVPPVTRARLPANSVGSNENCLASLPGRPTDITVPPFLISRVTRRGNRHELHAPTSELRILLAWPNILGTAKEKVMGKLDGKTTLITGGNSGIGLATAKRFVSEGAYVFITGRRDAELAAAVKEIGRNVTGVQGDVANLGDLDRLFAKIKREKGKLDIVFANAGVAKYGPLGKITEELYDWT